MDKQEKLIARLFRDTLIIFLLSFFAATVGSVVDGMIIGNFLGTEAIAAFGFTLPYQAFVAVFHAVIMLGMQIMCSKALGRGNLNEANGIFSSAVAVGLAVMIFLTVTTILFSEQIANILGTQENLGEIHTLTIDYLKGYSFTLPALALVETLMPIMQLDSDRKRALIATAILSTSNIAGDLINIFVLGGGLWGIGVATAISYWITAGIFIFDFFKVSARFSFFS